jgi:hypothetical protein
LKLFQESGEEQIKENNVEDELKYDIFDRLEELCKSHNVPHPAQ